jgi:SM-20-related protein
LHDAALFDEAPQLPLREQIASSLADGGWAVIPDALPAPLAAALLARARDLDRYRRAGVGRSGQRRRNPFVRRDEVSWIEGDGEAESQWLRWLDALRAYLNRELMLGLAEVESHFAHYPPGGFYRRHLDAFRGEANRVVSVVAYLNPEWLPADGGELVLYGTDAEIGRFPPLLGTLAVYLSERFPHEVLPTRRDRYSIAGWFRHRPDVQRLIQVDYR